MSHINLGINFIFLITIINNNNNLKDFFIIIIKTFTLYISNNFLIFQTKEKKCQIYIRIEISISKYY